MDSSEFVESINTVVRVSCKNLDKESANLYMELNTKLSIPEFLELFVWNIVVAFWVNMLATYLYDLLRGNVLNNEIKKLCEEVEKLRSEIIDGGSLVDKDKCLATLNKANNSFSLITQPYVSLADLVKHPSASDSGIGVAIRLLTDYGWPPEIAKRRAIEMADIIKVRFER